MRCSPCGRDNLTGAKFCSECGQPLPASCPACRAALAPGVKFCGACGRRVGGDAAAAPPTAEPDGGERRQLTVLFCDLVGSTELSARLDPEEWRDVVRRYQEAAAGVVERFGGHVAQYLGDGLLVYFGHPQAHDDDGERAVRAGLGLVDATRAIAADGTPLAVRVGIHTGPVVVGTMGGGARRETLALGETPNVAARVQGGAEPDTVVITAATQHLVAGMFVVEDRGPQMLKGMREPVTLYRVVQPSGVRGRLAAAAAAARSLTPFVGRDRELATLCDAWERAREGEGQVVFIVGEPGIGKSRLAQEFHTAIAGEPHTWLETGGAPYFSDTSFYAVIQLLQQFFAWRPEDSDEVRATMLARALEVTGLDPQTTLPLLAPLLDVPVPAGYPPVLAAPEVARKRLLATLAALPIGNARLQPLVIVLEDLHWVDAATLELNQLLVDQGTTVPMLLIFTARPEFRAPWPLRGHHTQLNLNRLQKRYVQEMVAEVAARAGLPAEVLEAVVSRTDGVPLFVEELTKAAVEAGARAVHEVPATLADSLMGRLDRLGPAAKEVAQIGSVIGREFSYALLSAVHAIAGSELDAAVAKLVEAELVYAQGLPPEATYTFKHALIQDTAYASLLKSRRRALHGRVAHALVEQAADLGAAPPELLAHHYTQAGEADSAVDAWRRAGRRFLRRCEPGAAVNALRQGLDVLQGMPESPGRAEQEFRLQLSLGQALTVAKGYGAPKTAAAFARARELGETMADPGPVAALLMGLWSATINSDGARAAQPLADQVLLVAERAGSRPIGTWAHFAQLSTRYWMGDLDGAREHARRALELYDEVNAIAVPIDPRVAILGFAALTEVQSGYGDRARTLARQGVEQARRSKRPADRAWAELHAAITFAHLRDAGNAAPHAAQALEACAEEANPQMQALAMIVGGWAMTESRNTTDGLATQQRTGLARFAATGQRLGLGVYAGLLADGLAHAGRFAEALAVLAEAEGACPGEDVGRPDTLRRRAELLVRTGAPDAEVEATFAGSLEVARRHGAKQAELRTATCYARWLRDHGRGGEGRALLAPIHGWFTEGFDTADLIEAKALLDDIR